MVMRDEEPMEENHSASTPPVLFVNGAPHGYVTRNQFLAGIDPDDLAQAIGRFDLVRGGW